MDNELTLTVEKVNALARALSAINNSFIPDRNKKDEIVRISSEMLLDSLMKLKSISR